MSAPKVHSLKCWPAPFFALRTGRNTSQFRKDDRGFEVGDLLWLHEWDPETERYSGLCCLFEITDIERGFGVPEGYAVLSIRVPETGEIRLVCANG